MVESIFGEQDPAADEKMTSMRELLLGLTIGFGAGVSPGPLLALVVTTSLRHGRVAGFQVAASPLVTDLPIIILALTVLGAVPGRAVAAVGTVGAAVVLKLGITTLRHARRAELPAAKDGATTHSLRHGVVVNLLSPHPWLFWLSVGGPLLITAWRHGALSGGAFLLGFYALLVGSKVALAALLSASRHRLSLSWYRGLLVLSAGLLLVAAVALALRFVPALVG
ncbi:MAG: LysE family transporter [Pseudonocardiaceae bacterium]